MLSKTHHQNHRWLITGGAGFIGSHFVDLCVRKQKKAGIEEPSIIILDALKYSGHPDNISKDACVQFVQGDICDLELVSKLLEEYEITHLVNFAAESHVDNSIHASEDFIKTNIEGTRILLEAARRYHKNNPDFRYIQISTDEVFGSLQEEDPAFTEETPFQPNSPYSSSKAGADMLVNAWHHTYDLPTVTTHCSNNYGPRQHPEKLIPHMITKALKGEKLPVYGDGQNIRDWIHAQDHAYGVYLAATQGNPGERYCFGGNCERRNLNIIEMICDYLDQIKPRQDGQSYREQITMVTDRLGHDYRYAINDKKAETELGFSRRHSFAESLKNTISWYIENPDWIARAKSATL